jgi:hypothetical protein
MPHLLRNEVENRTAREAVDMLPAVLGSGTRAVFFQSWATHDIPGDHITPWYHDRDVRLDYMR